MNLLLDDKKAYVTRVNVKLLAKWSGKKQHKKFHIKIVKQEPAHSQH